MSQNILERPIRQRLKDYFAPSMLATRLMYKNRMLGKGLELRMTAHGKFRYPLETMDRGQFFFVPNNGRSTVQTNNAVNSSVAHCRRKTGRQFIQRRLPTGVMVWRID